MATQRWIKVGHLKNVAAFRLRAAELGVALPCDDAIDASQTSPLAQSIDVGSPGQPLIVGNRWCIHPMEGWDGTSGGEPTDHTLRRWRHFGESGAKLIWGGEAFAVVGEGRANPNQLAVVADDVARAERGLVRLITTLSAGHRDKFNSTDDLLVGLQLTHSGRFCRPFDSQLRPLIAYHHPLLDAKFGIDADDNSVVINDDYLKRLTDYYVRAAALAQRVGFRFVDIKACHGYLGHELLSARTRTGPYGGSFENRTRFLRETILAIQAQCPGLMIGVRFSAFDQVPFTADQSAQSTGGSIGLGVPVKYKHALPYLYGFGCDMHDPMRIDLAEPIALVRMLSEVNVRLINVSAASPYYNPHLQRPAIFPPSDGYQPPEDPLVGVARQIDVAHQLKSACPNSIIVGSGYSYLQEYLPHVAQAVVREGWADFVGVGRLVLSYWDMPADLLNGRAMTSNRICRTFSDCTTAPRNGIISGCYPLDPHYKAAPEHAALKQVKAKVRKSLDVLP